jgi:hypothetical protein
VEESIAEVVGALIDAGLDEDHRRLLAHAVVGMAESAGRHFLATRGEGDPTAEEPPGSEATRLAARLADLAWAGLRSVHPD